MAMMMDYIKMNKILEAIDACFENARDSALIGVPSFVRIHLDAAERILKDKKVQNLAVGLGVEAVLARRKKMLETYRRDLLRLAEIQHRIIYEDRDPEVFEDEVYAILKRISRC